MINNKYLIIIIIIIISIIINYKILENYEEINNIYDKIDVIYYINLKDREDRNKDFLEEMKNMDIPVNKIERINAVKNERGEIGCSNSHINTLKKFINSNYENCIIFEDDFQFIVSKEIFIDILNKIFNNNVNYDLIMLSGYIAEYDTTNYDFLYKVLNGQTASGYLISKKFAPILLNNFIESEKLLREHPPEYYEKYAIDQYWKKLQPNSKWFITNPTLGLQRPSYSDILKVNVNYGS
jgi:GR25 family glycosyltransferase involved in LPS biosynthesis